LVAQPRETCREPVVRYSLLPRLTVLAPTAAEAVSYAGGWLFDQVLAGYWASANRDAGEFDAPDTFDPGRERNRHIAFGAGPHRCVGSNLARMNLRVAIEEVVGRMTDFKLKPGADIDFHSTFNRAPLSVPITFTPTERPQVLPG
jgi:cytochrome P450